MPWADAFTLTAGDLPLILLALLLLTTGFFLAVVNEPFLVDAILASRSRNGRVVAAVLIVIFCFLAAVLDFCLAMGTLLAFWFPRVVAPFEEISFVLFPKNDEEELD